MHQPSSIRLALIAAAVALFSPLLGAASVAVSGESEFTGGLFGHWSHTYTTGAPNLFIQSITIDVSPNSMIYDTVLTPPGAGLPQNFATTSDGGTSFTGFNPSGAALDGQSVVVLSFSNFTPGKTYEHVGDVDQTATCSGTPAQIALCRLANQTIT